MSSLIVRRTDALDLGFGVCPVRLDVPLLDDYLIFLAGRCRPNTVLATAYDLKVFFTVVGKQPPDVATADVLAFMTAQRAGETGSGRLVAAPAGDLVGVSSRTLRRRLSSVSGLFAYLQVRGDIAANPVPRGLPTRRERHRPRQGVPLVRARRTLPRILEPAQVDALTAALRTHRDRAMVAAMVLGGLRRCEVLGLRLEDVRVGERRVFIADGKGGHQRLVPVSGRFFIAVAAYLERERPAGADTDRLFLVLKGPHRGKPLSADGLDQVLDGARDRAGLAHATCHQLRHTCLTRLREAGMALEAVQAQAGHVSIESTRLYLHLADDWLASQYRAAAEAIDAQMLTRTTPATPGDTPPSQPSSSPPPSSSSSSSCSPPSPPSPPSLPSLPVTPVASAFSPRSSSPATAQPDGASRSLRALRGTGRDGIRGGGRGGAR
jgi:site-specific recombinase XerD